MEVQTNLGNLIWTLLASMAGSVTALSFRPYKNMTPRDIALSLIVGFSFAVFVGPLVVETALKNFGPHIQGAAYYIMASGWNVLVPFFYRKFFGLDKEPGS